MMMWLCCNGDKNTKKTGNAKDEVEKMIGLNE